MAKDLARVAALVVLSWSSSCALLTPVNEISDDAPADTCRGERCKDAGRGTPPVDMDSGRDAVKPPTGDAAMAMDAMTSGAPPCVPPMNADCDPIRRCGCGDGQECGLDLAEERVRCVPKQRGTRGEGEPCVDPDDCASGLQCNEVHVCSRYCASDDDCSGKGKCLEYKLISTLLRVPGSATCSRWCDPLEGAECLDGTACYAAGETDMDPNATCRGFYDAGRKARGEACEWYNECEAGLSCAEFGPHVCTSFCKSDRDCPAQTPHCYTEFRKPFVASPQERVGQCVIWPCDDTTVGEPPAWTEGHVWNSDQHAACFRRCGNSNPDCARQNCLDATRWGQCWDTALAACAGAKGAACRSQYVAFACSEFASRSIPKNAFGTCANAQSDCWAVATRTCAEPL